jgi:hypothetical protein
LHRIAGRKLDRHGLRGLEHYLFAGLKELLRRYFFMQSEPIIQGEQLGGIRFEIVEELLIEGSPTNIAWFTLFDRREKLVCNRLLETIGGIMWEVRNSEEKVTLKIPPFTMLEWNCLTLELMRDLFHLMHEWFLNPASFKFDKNIDWLYKQDEALADQQQFRT